MTTEQTVTPGIQTIPLLDETKALRSSFNRAIGITLLMLVILNVIVAIVQVIMATPFYAQMFQPGADFQAIMMEMMKALTTQLRYVFVPNVIGLSITYAVMCPAGCKMLKMKMKDIISFKGFTVELVVCGILLGLGVQKLFSSLAYFVADILKEGGIKAMTLNTSIDGDPLGMTAMVISACLIAPVFEEIIFRGFILRTFSQKNVWFGIIASSVMFGLFHGNIQQLIATTAMGFVMALAATKAKSIVPSIAIHFAMNVTGIGMDFITYYAGMEIARTVDLILSAVVIVASVLIIIFKRKIFAPEKVQAEASGNGAPVKSFNVLLSCWTVWVFLGVQLLTILIMTRKVM